ncbi:hypothetical protein BCR42DRAFT_415695 [Absidia repens]|uniref:Uncharacterized protein n=1 Tax=Absidia repens TaxID=90262 RepID=A0A1X2IH63_9FUNG|nr:hypothetical protein BCR42DRAFT_415695 [Absidia repens]
MIIKHVRFQMHPKVNHYYHETSDCEDPMKQRKISPAPPFCENQHPSSSSKLPLKNSSSNPPVLSKRPAIPPLDFSHLRDHALKPHTTNTNVKTISVSRPLSPPVLSIDTLHHTPRYYTALSTSYFQNT